MKMGLRTREVSSKNAGLLKTREVSQNTSTRNTVYFYYKQMYLFLPTFFERRRQLRFFDAYCWDRIWRTF